MAAATAASPKISVHVENVLLELTIRLERS